MAELLLRSLNPRWRVSPEVAVRRPSRGFVDAVLIEPREPVIVATELDSDLRRIEQLLRWSQEKAAALPSSDGWPVWTRSGEPRTSRLLVVRHTRANRTAAVEARRQLREAYPADPRDALESLVGTAAWPGAALLWARLETDPPRLSAD